MKIGILTQPLGHNHGGILQAYALQKYLRDNGHDAWTIDIPNVSPRLWGLPAITKGFIRKYFLNQDLKNIFPLSPSMQGRLQVHTRQFMREHMQLKRLSNKKNFYDLNDEHFEAFIVGSDQVWRPSYSPNLPAFFLDFAPERAFKIAYAASFGVDHGREFKSRELVKYSRLLQKFNAVSVREDSGVLLCKTLFGVKACQVIDPTLLLNEHDYLTLFKDETLETSGKFLTYVLDDNPIIQNSIASVTKKMGLPSFNLAPSCSRGVYLPISKWLRGFFEAKAVLTDSFHGVIFSIIFKKPFVALGNESRGLARFSSLLKIFGLENRLVPTASANRTIELLEKRIDFEKVNKIIISKQIEAKIFLNEALKRVS